MTISIPKEEWYPILFDLARNGGVSDEEYFSAVLRTLAPKYPNQNEQYEFLEMSMKPEYDLHSKRGSGLLRETLSKLSGLGFFSPLFSKPDRRLYYLAVSQLPVNKQYIEDFLEYNVAKNGEGHPEIVSYIVFDYALEVLEEDVRQVKSLLLDIYETHYDIVVHDDLSFEDAEGISSFVVAGIYETKGITLDINKDMSVIQQSVEACKDWYLYDYVIDSQVQPINLTRLRELAPIGEGSFVEEAFFYQEVWDAVLAAKRSGKLPILHTTVSPRDEDYTIMSVMVALENVRLYLPDNSYVTKFCKDYSRLVAKCCLFAEDRIKFIMYYPDIFFAFRNYRYFFGQKESQEFFLELGEVKIVPDATNENYKIASVEETFVEFDLDSVRSGKIEIVSYKDLQFVTTEDTFEGVLGKQGRLFSLTKAGDKVLTRLFGEYEQLLVKTKEKLNPLYHLGDTEYLSLRNCIFYIRNGELYMARILRFSIEMDCAMVQIMHMVNENIDLGSRIFINPVNDFNKAVDLLHPLTAMADYDGTALYQYIDTEEGETEVQVATVPKLGLDGIFGSLLLSRVRTKYTNAFVENLRNMRDKGLDAAAMGKFERHSSVLEPNWKNETSAVWDVLKRHEMRRLGYISAYGGDNIILRDSKIILTADVFKKEG